MARPVSESTVACSCSAATSRSCVPLARTSITAITTSTAPKKTKSVTAAAAGSRRNRVSRRRAGPRGHQRHAGRTQVRGGEEAPGRRRTPAPPPRCRRSAGSACRSGRRRRRRRAAPTPNRSSGLRGDDAAGDRRATSGSRTPSQWTASVQRIGTGLLEDREPGDDGSADQQDQPRTVRGRLRDRAPAAHRTCVTLQTSAAIAERSRYASPARGRAGRWHDRPMAEAPLARPSPVPRDEVAELLSDLIRIDTTNTGDTSDERGGAGGRGVGRLQARRGRHRVGDPRVRARAGPAWSPASRAPTAAARRCWSTATWTSSPPTRPSGASTRSPARSATATSGAAARST